MGGVDVAAVLAGFGERVRLPVHLPPQREFLIANLLVRIHFIIVMIRWTGLAALPGFEERVRLSVHLSRRGNNFNGFEDFYLKAKARIWP